MTVLSLAPLLTRNLFTTTQVQYTDGLLMPFISHGRNEPWQIGRDYDDEIIVFMADCELAWLLGVLQIKTDTTSPASLRVPRPR